MSEQWNYERFIFIFPYFNFLLIFLFYLSVKVQTVNIILGFPGHIVATIQLYSTNSMKEATDNTKQMGVTVFQ